MKKLFVRSQDDRDKFVQEAILHGSLRHPNIVQMIGICLDPVCVIMEFMSRGSLFACLNDTSIYLDWVQRLSFVRNIAEGMSFLHARDLIHRDLKSLNVLVNQEWKAKISDFGQTRYHGIGCKTVGLGTMLWSAPELLSGVGDYDQQVDVYSFAIVLWEIAARAAPYSMNTDFPSRPMQQLLYIKEGSRPFVPADVPAWYQDIMKAAWSPIPSDRPTFVDILESLDVEIGHASLQVDTGNREMNVPLLQL